MATPTWENLVNVTVSDGGTTLTKSGGAAAWDAGASSVQSYPLGSPCWVEFKAGETNTIKLMGIGYTNVDASSGDVEYGIRLNSVGVVSVNELGASKGNYGTYTVNDVFKVHSNGSEVTYYKNDSLFYTSLTAVTDALFIDCSLHTVSTYASLTEINFSPGIIVSATNGLSSADNLGVNWYLLADTEGWDDIGSPIQSGSTAWSLSGGDSTFSFNFGQGDGDYKLLIYTDVDTSAARNFGDTYLEYDVTIAGEDITYTPSTYDWSIYLDTSSEYTGFTSESLWPLIPESIRSRDADTTQIKINGEDRGQFQRYIMTLSRLMSLVIGKQVNAKKSHGFDDTNAEFLFRELESRGLPFSSDWTTPRQRIVFEDSVYHNKHAGVFTTLKAITTRFFGWVMTSKAFEADNVFVLNNEDSVLFYDDIDPTADPGNPGNDTAFITGYYTGLSDASYTAEVTGAGAWNGTAELTVTGTGGDIFGPTVKNPVDAAPESIGGEGLSFTITDGGGGASVGDIWTWTAKRLKPLYDPDLHSDLSGATYTVDVQSDANFATKQPDFERLLSGFVPSGFTITWNYTNVP